MKKIIFKIGGKNKENVAALIREVNKFSCRIQIDFEQGIITVENIKDEIIDSIIELIYHNYKISSIDINNSCEKLKNNVESSEILAETNEFPLNSNIEKLVKNLLKTAHWAINVKNASEKEVSNFIMSAKNEISIRYNNKECVTNSSEEQSQKNNVKCALGENVLLELVGNSIEKIDKSQTLENQVKFFLNDIGMESNELVIQAFIVACETEKIRYQNIIGKLHNMFPKEKENKIKNILKCSFKTWFEKKNHGNEELYKKISFMSLLKLFAKNYNKKIH